MSEDIVPHDTSRAQMLGAGPPPPLTIPQRALQEVLAHPKKYPVRVQPRKRDGRLNVTIHLPALVDGEWQSLKHKLCCTEAELFALCAAIMPPTQTMIARQYRRAIAQLMQDRFPKRRDLRSLVAFIVRGEAQFVYPLLQALLRYPDHWSVRFEFMMKTVTHILSRAPNARELTAWLVESLHALPFDAAGVIRPTQGMGHADWDGGTRFANRYLYTDKPQRKAPVCPPAVAAFCLEERLETIYP